MASSQAAQKKRPLKDRLQDRYRMVILNDDTFEEVSSYNLSLKNIYVLISSFIVALGLLIVSLIVFTPVKKLIPGYADFESNPKFIQLTKDFEAIQDSIASQQVYIDGIRNLLTADGSTLEIEENVTLTRPVQTVSLEQMSTISVSNSNAKVSLLSPLEGIVSLSFDPEIKHFGIDVLAPKGSPIKAISEGHVIMSGWNLETGHTIGIQHKGDFLSFYKHNLKNLKEEGDYVKAGEAIAIIGNSGTLSDGPHLHFELWYNGNPVNPEDYLNFK